MLRKYVHGAIHIWDQFVDAALFAARVRKHTSAGLLLIRNEQKCGLEYNWMGPFTVTAKNDVTNIYKLVSVGGEPYLSCVHVDRLKEAKAEYIDTLGTIPLYLVLLVVLM
ncbi:hypothetical protein RMATCC62417_11531 [Rhizopus microsporus]|nr:hypothetical protein RMATCC62417_11531 [Rhizopus microsporus]